MRWNMSNTFNITGISKDGDCRSLGTVQAYNHYFACILFRHIHEELAQRYDKLQANEVHNG